MQWQPIETAPKGKKIIVYYKNENGKGRTVVAKFVPRFSEECDCDDGGSWEYSPQDDDKYYTKEGWYEVAENFDEYGGFGLHHKPTHWMPLPKPPVGEK